MEDGQMTVREKIENDYYATAIARPDPAVLNESEFRAARQAIREDEQRLRDQFQRDLEIEHGVYQHAKADKLFQLCYRDHHSAGLFEVESVYADYVDLIK